MLSIYETLKGKYLNNAALPEFPDDDDLLLSIHDHLIRLLNARQGVLGHLPDYGLPDVNRYYQNLPYSQDDMASTVKDVIEKYEPRLHKVRVEPLSQDFMSAVVRMEISGWVVGGDRVRFKTYFKSSGEAQVFKPTHLGSAG